MVQFANNAGSIEEIYLDKGLFYGTDAPLITNPHFDGGSGRAHDDWGFMMRVILNEATHAHRGDSEEGYEADWVRDFCGPHDGNS